MIWLTWRQHRIGLLIFGLMLAGLTAFIIGGSHDAYSAYYQVVHGKSIATCALQATQDAACDAVRAGFYIRYLDDGPLSIPLSPLIILPPLIGMFLGAPLVASELERGTYRLIWTQGVTRLRWLAVKVCAQMGIILPVFALISLLVMWWNGPFNRLGGDMGALPFDFEGIVPLAYAAYALALGVAAGAFLRNTVLAMIVTLLGYLAVRIPIDTWVRPHYLPPLSVTWDAYSTPAPQAPFAAPRGTYNDWNWFVYKGWITRAGQPLGAADFSICGGDPGPFGYSYGDMGQPGTPFTACAHAHGWLSMIIWQPHDRFWLFQGIESAIFFSLAAVLLALAFWWVRTRIS
jgi:hypothetical protein